VPRSGHCAKRGVTNVVERTFGQKTDSSVMPTSIALMDTNKAQFKVSKVTPAYWRLENLNDTASRSDRAYRCAELGGHQRLQIEQGRLALPVEARIQFGYLSMLDLVTELDQKLSLDREARRLGVTRQSLIKLWLADKLGQPAAAAKRCVGACSSELGADVSEPYPHFAQRTSKTKVGHA
jgi:hypothetical protein